MSKWSARGREGERGVVDVRGLGARLVLGVSPPAWIDVHTDGLTWEGGPDLVLCVRMGRFRVHIVPDLHIAVVRHILCTFYAFIVCM